MLDAIQIKTLKNTNYHPKKLSEISFGAQMSELGDRYVSQSSLKYLFSDGIQNAKFCQRDLPDCQLLALFDAFSNNKKGSKMLQNMFKMLPDGKTVQINFPANPKSPVEINLDDVKIDIANQENKTGYMRFKMFLTTFMEYLKTGNKDHIKINPPDTPLGIYIFEHAYAKFVNPDLYNDKSLYPVFYDKNYHGDGFICMKDIVDANACVIRTPEYENAHTHTIPLSSLSSQEKNKIHQILKEMSQDSDSYLISASTISSKEKKFTKKFISWHEYSIRKVDYENDKITIANPWNTSKTREISIDELMNNFESFQYIKM